MDADHKEAVLNRFKFMTEAIPTLRRLPPLPMPHVTLRRWFTASMIGSGFAIPGMTPVLRLSSPLGGKALIS